MNFLVAHKHLILTVVIAVALYAMVAKVQAHFDGVAHDQRVLAEQQVKEDLDKARIQAAQTAQDKMDLQRQLNSLAASNVDLKASLLALRSQLKDQQTKDALLAPDALAGRWSMLIGVAPSEIKPGGTGLLASLAASHTTVAMLEEIPVLHQEVDKKDANSTAKDATILKQQQLIGDLNGELGTCKKTQVDADTACKAKVKEEQAKASKAKRNWFVAGVIATLGVVFGIKR